jgi:hypothetical protein
LGRPRRQCHNPPTGTGGFVSSPSDVVHVLLEIAAILGEQLFADPVHFFHDGIFSHVCSCGSSNGVQMIGGS